MLFAIRSSPPAILWPIFKCGSLRLVPLFAADKRRSHLLVATLSEVFSSGSGRVWRWVGVPFWSKWVWHSRGVHIFEKVVFHPFGLDCETQAVFNITSCLAPGGPKGSPGETSPRIKHGLLVSAALLFYKNGPKRLTTTLWKLCPYPERQAHFGQNGTPTPG